MRPSNLLWFSVGVCVSGIAFTGSVAALGLMLAFVAAATYARSVGF